MLKDIGSKRFVQISEFQRKKIMGAKIGLITTHNLRLMSNIGRLGFNHARTSGRNCFVS